MSIPSIPSANSSTDSALPSNSNLKKSPSTRISQLVSRFERPSSRLEVNPSAGPSSAFRPTEPVALAKSWSNLGGGRVKRNLKGFSTDAQPTEAVEVKRRNSVKSLDFVEGTVEGMDWTPRIRPPVSTSKTDTVLPTASPAPPPPAARFRHFPRSDRVTESNRKRQSAPLTTSSTKSTAAQTVLVPGSVSTNPHGKTKMQIEASRTTVPVQPESEVKTETANSPQFITLNPSPLSNSSPPLLSPLPSYASATLSSLSPTFASSEDTIVERSSPIRPPLYPRQTSLTFVSTEKSFESTPPVKTPVHLDESVYPLPSSSFPIPLNLPSQASRPGLPRGGTSFTTTSTAATHSYPAHQIFARDAAPLHLPDLDATLESLGGSPEFSKVPVNLEMGEGRRVGRDCETVELGEVGKDGKNEKSFGSEEEEKAWNDWVRGTSPGLWTRLTQRLKAEKEVEDDKERLIGAEAEKANLTKDQHLRSLIFPPFHRLSSDMTLTYLKSNIRRPPSLISGNALLQTAADGILNLFGSAAGIRLTTVEGLRDLMQMITLLVTSASPSLSLLTVSAPSTAHTIVETSTFRTIFITIPSALSLDFASAFGQALLFLFLLTFFAFLGLYEFYRFTGGWQGPKGVVRRGETDLGEGYDREDLHVRKKRFRDRKGWRIAVTFFLTSIYLPLSKLSLSALFWERGYWPSELLGTDPLDDRCFTTIPRGGGKGFNSAIAIFPVALCVLGLLSCWFPMRMYGIVQSSRPSIDRFTELGEVRRDRKGEYERLLDIDPSPYSFLYREYRREWATFRAIYMAVKLLNVFIVVLISSDNCIFKDFDEPKLSIIRQGSLFAFMGLFFLLDVYTRPQLDEISNRSDRISRLGYVGISLCGLLVALSVPGKNFFENSAVVIINAFAYSFNIYFSIIGTQLLKRFVKQVQRRLDFSIDIFSPRLDIEKHISRRIWQETISTLFFTSPDFAMKPDTRLVYTKDPELAPYLLNFQGSPAERHAENLKILREIGLDAYTDAITAQRHLKASSHVLKLREKLQHQLAGPDIYYRPPSSVSPLVSSFFGRLDIGPFPFIVIFRFDQDPENPLYLSSLEELEDLIEQQDIAEVRSARKIRLLLRALEGQLVYAPRIETKSFEKKRGFGFEYQVTYEMATLKIERNSSFLWQGYNYSSGFDVSLEYKDGLGIDNTGKPRSNIELVLLANQCGILGDFSLTKPLATLLSNNRGIIEKRLPLVEDALNRYRQFFAKEFDSKRCTLSYDFLTSVFAQDHQSIAQLGQTLRETEKNEKVRRMVKNHPSTFRSLEERMNAVKSSRIRALWFVTFDDLWRRNGVFWSKPNDFSPHYSSSICYRPMPRAQLEAFLNERGFATKGRAFFSSGFLNRLYLVLDEMAFSSTDHAVPIHLASNPDQPVHYSSLPRKLARPEASETTTISRITAGTGDGTNEDDRYIRARMNFRFEEAFDRPRPPFTSGHRWDAVKFFFGVRVKKGTKKWLGWTLNETDHRKRGKEAILFDLREGREGWEIPRIAH